MKKLLKLITALTLLSFSVKADVVSGTVATNGIVIALTNAVVINSIQLSAGTGAPFGLTMYDNSVASIVYTNVAYTNVVSYTTNLTNTFVGATGVTNTYVTTSLYTDRTVTAANTNVSYTAIGAWMVGTSESLLIPGPFSMARGVIFKPIAPNTNGVYIINYRNNP